MDAKALINFWRQHCNQNIEDREAFVMRVKLQMNKGCRQKQYGFFLKFFYSHVSTPKDYEETLSV